jgi:glycosidase
VNFHDARVIPNVCFLLKWSGKALLFFSLTSFAANSRVSRVEPPNWWVGHTHNPVRLLISGENLTNGHLVVAAPFKLGPATVSENCRWLFVDLTIPASASPGEVALGFVSDKNVEQKVPFKLLPRLGPEQKASGMSSDDVVYLVMTDRFANGDASNDNPAGSPGLCDRRKLRRYHGGDFQGVLDHLDYLQELGVTTLWLTPWYDNANQLNFIQQFSPDYTNSAQREPSADYHGYGVTDFYAVEEHFGTMELLQKLVRQAHVLGMKVMQDQIVNLTSPYHPWLTNSPTPTWYNGTVKHHLANNFQTWTVTASNPPPDQLRATLDGWFFGILPDLNQNDPEVATYLIQNSLWWLGMTGADVVRQDALPYVPRNYWARWSQELKREFPRLTVLGEMWDGLPRRVAFFQGGSRRFDGIDSGVDALFDFPLYYAMHDVFLAGKPMSRLGEVLAADREYVNASALVTFLGLHDL